MRKWRLNFRVLSLFSLVAVLLAGCGEPFLSTLRPAGEVAEKQYSLMLLSTAIMVLVIIVVTIIFVYVVVRFKRRKGEEDVIPKQVEGNHKLEILWTVIPIILLVILAVPTVADTFKLADVKGMEKEDAIVVNVRANLYWWEFEYPNQKIITSQDLVVPTDTKVYFNVKASDVKHSFWIPSVGGKVDTNTENENKFWLVFDSEKAESANGLFYGKCAELCGPSHAYMDFKVKALPSEEFDTWVSDIKDVKPDVSTASAKAGEEIFTESCIGCHAVEAQDGRPEQARQAPNLAGFADRERIAGVLEHNEENLKQWLKNPEEIKPGNKMSNTYPDLTDEQVDQLTEYLLELKEK
ncbi:cytochrome c oxidase subunit II [Priestia flexa]|jgi:cytochrome c oxidase subunit II|uniref:Cytochrome c oxidase subunit 2 n=1 Tax=Priestia flexa TaxID=86664 RepID=A0A1N6XKU8_9BACI|nr:MULTISPECIES: cytochrome c oxidase subunit II [Bacillaceae]OZT12377.1 cytochrome c oxidase subunit II [Priestia aryabhattai]AQX55331.1 cytochrome c oxidase subunit II [Priestia flexa]MBN8252444.1 cytochrome c oxidase subunit II [Priestia flexa]MBN8433914.1 cytochrome c oxidase subunit II [Priestia flexa]MBY6087730.1 cytochrome c oxidase subunit II [Priestia flexa]